MIEVEKEASVVTLTLKRPRTRNALGPTLIRELQTALNGLDINDCRALVMRAVPVAPTSGEVATWIAGGDLKELATLDADAAREFSDHATNLCQSIEDLPIPTLAAIDGSVFGGGIEFALAFDIRIATQQSRFDFTQLRVGLTTGFGGAKRLVSLIGKARALDLLLRTRSLSASEAINVGLISELCKNPDDLHHTIGQFSELWRSFDPSAVAIQKKMLADRNRGDAEPSPSEPEMFASVWRNPKHSQFLSSFVARAKGGRPK